MSTEGGGGGGEEETSKKCFSVVQQRGFWAPVAVSSTASLCPSMDLLCFGLRQSGGQRRLRGGSAVHLHLHRTVTWQKLAALPPPAEAESVLSTHAAWRPDGRVLAVAQTDGDRGFLWLHRVEDLLNGDASAAASPSADSLVESELDPSATVLPAGSGVVTGLAWAHCGNPRPASWKSAVEDDEDSDDDDGGEDVHWRHRSRYVDRERDVLPPSEYHEAGSTAPNNVLLVSAKTPLSVLYISTASSGLHLYLHGRYPIALSLPLPAGAKREEADATDVSVSMVASSDLTHVLLLNNDEKEGTGYERTMTLYSFPALAANRYPLQIVSTLYCKISSHLAALRTAQCEITASWKISLKPLDLKWGNLFQHLRNYGLLEPHVDLRDVFEMRKLLVQYILSGHIDQHHDLVSAMEQFFSGVQMNDQLLVRMERSLAAALANVESTARRTLLAPATALVYEVGQLYGLARHRPDLFCASQPDSGTKRRRRQHEDQVQRLMVQTELLYVAVETAMTAIVRDRFCLRDTVAWMRAVGSHVKARGTAPRSAQRENAQKRRVTEAVVKRMLGYLQREEYPEEFRFSTTENLLGLQFAALLLQQSEETALLASRPGSPSPVRTSESFVLGKATPTVPYALQQTSDATEQVFENPRTFLSQSIRRTDLWLPGPYVAEASSTRRTVAITTRMGLGGRVPKGPPGVKDPKGYFCPTALMLEKSVDDAAAQQCRQWALVACAVGTCVQLHALPLGDDVGLASCSTQWTTCLQLPKSLCIQDVCFYGDDGKSSLSSSSTDSSGTTGQKEGRQALGLLVSRGARLELWLLQYDDAEFRSVSLEQRAGGFSLNVPDSSVVPVVNVLPMPESYDPESHDDVPDDTIYAKTRDIPSAAGHETACRLVVSGSRGIGAVFTDQGASMVELLDLEEDEGDDMDEEEEEEEEEDDEAEDMDEE